ncbi:nucleotide exchange factor GrpE [Aquirufa sp.]|jgi:molecular chaperone GrpE|uniref:nucleotide exchange factor GrpE n=1 Tax=Aquirufa sp. TaxID=2676249 RepID=UPI0037C0744A
MKKKENKQPLADENQQDVVVEAQSEETITDEQAATDELEEMKKKYLLLYADFENFRKNKAKERIELLQTAAAGLITDLLPSIDNYERALANAPEGEISEGIQLIFKGIVTTLQSKGLKELPAKGEVFNADFHDCITQYPAPSEEEKGKVLDVLEKGYTLHDKVIRFAKVVVGN